MTGAPPNSRLHLVSALLGTALLALALAWPALATPPGGTPPGQAKKATPPGQAKKATPPGQAKKGTPPGQAKKGTPPGQAKKATPPGQAKKGTPPGQAKKATPPGQAKKAVSQSAAAQSATPPAAPEPAADARARARRRAARARADAAARRQAAARRRTTAANRRASAVARARRARAAQSVGAAAPTGAASGDRANRDGSGRGDRQRQPNWPLTQEQELPQPLRVVRDIVEVVPTPLRFLVAGLVALSILLALASGLTLLRNRRLAHQRRELLGQVGLLQAALLPELPDNVGSARASVAYRPADGPGAGGDFYDVFPLAAGKTAVLIGDVSGHGREALGRTALARYTLRAYVEAGLEPRESVQIAGSVLTGKLQGDFVTALVAICDAADGTLTYATAGHPPPIVVSAAGFDPVLAGTAPPLGVGSGTGRRQTTVPFPRGSVACFYTDGLTEARTAGGRVGAERLEEVVRELGSSITAKKVIDSVSTSAGKITDDAAVCVIEAVEGASIVRSRLERLELSRGELRGSLLPEFLQACGVSLQRVRAAEREARSVAREYGGAIVEVRMGDRADVQIRPPELPLHDDVTASLVHD